MTPGPWDVLSNGVCVVGPCERPVGEPQTAGIAHCGMQLRSEDEARANAAAIKHLPRMVELLELLFNRDCRVYAHELTIPLHTHRDAVRALFEARELLQDLRKVA
ncbi:MAG TPA: hypothetical protein PKJ45_10270 [Rubrivivax sp.]|nr:hypothetical protein [Rubrivivax sp.]